MPGVKVLALTQVNTALPCSSYPRSQLTVRLVPSLWGYLLRFIFGVIQIIHWVIVVPFNLDNHNIYIDYGLDSKMVV